MRVGELDAEMVSLIPDQILMKEKTELTMYFITQWAIVQTEPSNPDIGISMIVVMKRRIMNEMLTTYLPSILLMLITYSTTFFKPYFFGASLFKLIPDDTAISDSLDKNLWVVSFEYLTTRQRVVRTPTSAAARLS